MMEPRFGEVWEWPGKNKVTVMVIGPQYEPPDNIEDRLWQVIHIAPGWLPSQTPGQLTEYHLLHPAGKWVRINV